MSSIAEKEIADLGFTYATEAQYDLDKIDANKTVQVRNAAHVAPKESVERFRVQMPHTAFPPIVVTRDGYLVDGNTRVAARRADKQKFYGALVLDVDYKGKATTQAQVAKLQILAATLNTNAGQALDKREQRAAVEVGIEFGLTNHQIEQRYGVKASVINLVKREMEGTARLTRLGMDPNAGLTKTALRALGAKPTLVLHDAPYRLVARHAVAAGLNSTEINALVKSASVLGSEAEQVAYLGVQATLDRDRIEQRHLTGDSHPMPSRTLRQHLGFVNKYADNPLALLETDSANVPAAVAAVKTALSVLTVLLEAQGS